jgi:hypothetical protein
MTSSVGKIAFGISIASLCCQPVAAQDALAEKLASRQTWTMSAPRGQTPPECVETWTFNADGQMTVTSGAEIVLQQWRVGDDKGQASLYTRRLSSTGGLDCVGAPNEAADQPENDEGGPLWVLAFNSGDAVLLCNPKYVLVEKTKEQMPMMDDENCWGELKPAP